MRERARERNASIDREDHGHEACVIDALVGVTTFVYPRRREHRIASARPIRRWTP